MAKHGSLELLAPDGTCEEIRRSLRQTYKVGSPVINVTALTRLRSVRSRRRRKQTTRLSLYEWGTVKYVCKPIPETVLQNNKTQNQKTTSVISLQLTLQAQLPETSGVSENTCPQPLARSHAVSPSIAADNSYCVSPAHPMESEHFRSKVLTAEISSDYNLRYYA